MEPIIGTRFSGPPGSGNGGYAAGIAASYVEGPATVTLRKPPPLDVRMDVERDGDRTLFLVGGDLVIEAEPGGPVGDVPVPPSLEDARAARPDPALLADHVFPECFVCGPARAAGDGLRIWVGPAGDVVAAVWVPDPSLRYNDGEVGRPYLWAALDCPSGWAAFDTSQASGTPIVLGRIAGEVRRNARVGEELIVTAWPIGAEGRKRFAGSAIHAADGELIARATATWIELR